jgi:hypothetical protein
MGLFDNLNQVARFARNVNTVVEQMANATPRPGSSGYGQQGSPAPVQPYTLSENFTVTLNGSGNGTARISPGQPGAPGSGVGAGRNSGLLWNVDGVAVSVATNTAESNANAFVSYGIMSAGPPDLQGNTQQGSTGDTCTFSASLRPGDWITVTWTGGDPGQVATARVFGTVTPPGM